MQSLTIITIACSICFTLAQYDSPPPPRPIIPGAIPIGASPVGGGASRPVLRRRPQPQPSQDLPPRRIATGRGQNGGPVRRLPPPLLEQSLVPQRPSRPLYNTEPIIRAPQLPSPPPIPSSVAPPVSLSSLPQQYSPQPLPQISPRPVIEESEDEEDQPPVQPQQLAFRPSPLDDLPIPTRQQYNRPTPSSVQTLSEDEQPTYIRQSRPQQEIVRQQPQPETIRQPTRQSYQDRGRQQQQQQPQQSQPTRSSAQQYNARQQQVISRQSQKELDKPSEPRSRKPEVQNIRKYRQDNEDGSITWGFENDDGTYKEETIGIDCVTRGKYGYVDPDGVRREFSYESGNPCDKRDTETQETNEGYIDYSNNRYVFPNGEAIDLDNMVKNKARKQPSYRN